MIAGELSQLAGETLAAVGKEKFSFAEFSGVQENVAARRVACRILEIEPKIEIAQRYPDGFAAPARVNDLVGKREQGKKACAGFWRQDFFEPANELIRSGLNADVFNRVSIE